MGERQKILLVSILLLALAALGTAGLSIFLLYETAVDEQESMLSDAVHVWAGLLETVARHDAAQNNLSPDAALQVALAQFKEAHSSNPGLCRNASYAIARRQGDSIIYLMRRTQGQDENPGEVPFSSKPAEPMRRALMGQDGTMIGPDGRGQAVLSAYHPLPGLGLGVVAQKDLAEVREPYILAGLAALAAALVLIAAGALGLWRLTHPLMRRLEESEARFRQAFTQSPLGMALVDAGGRFQMVNSSLCRMLGYSPVELTQLTFSQVTHPEDLDAGLTVFRELLAGKRGWARLEKRYLRQDGGVIWALLVTSPLRGPEGQVSYLVSQIEDITERKRHEIKLGELAAIVASSEDSIVSVDMEGSITSWNRGAEHTYGYPAAEALGRPISMLIPQGHLDQGLAYMAKAKAGGSIEQYETLRLTKNGRLINVSLTVSPIRGQDNRLEGISFIARDITQRIKAAAEREALIAKLQEALARVRTLSGLLPICSSCKKIRNDQGYWEQLETYIASRSEADFTHGICPDCLARLYPYLRLEKPEG